MGNFFVVLYIYDAPQGEIFYLREYNSIVTITSSTCLIMKIQFPSQVFIVDFYIFLRLF